LVYVWRRVSARSSLLPALKPEESFLRAVGVGAVKPRGFAIFLD